MEYRFEEIQELRFVVLDVDDRKHVDDVSRHDHIGSVECTLADIVTAGQRYKRTLRDKGIIIITIRHRVIAMFCDSLSLFLS